MTFLEEVQNMLQPVNEVYFGTNNKELDDLQAQFTKFREPWISRGTYSIKINTDPELQKFNRMCEKFFGFKRFALVIEPKMEKNAYTFPLSGRIDVPVDTKKYLIKTKNGFKYNDEVNYSCMVFMNSSFVVDSKFTDREVFAIFLHEVGHNFQQNFNPASTFNGALYKILNLITLPYEMIYGIMNPLGQHAQAVVGSVDALNNHVIKKADKMKKENKELVEAFYVAKNIMSICISIMFNYMVLISKALFFTGPISSILNILFNKIISTIKNPLKIILSALGYKGEKLSDEFATIYGYGPDLASALEKTDYEGSTGLIVEDIFSNIPILNNMYDLFFLPIRFLFDPFEAHPETVSRAKNQLRMLEKELTKNGIDPRMKKEIQSNIDELNKTIDKMTKVKMGDTRYIRKGYAAFMLKLSGGDLRELFNKNDPIGDYDRFEETPVSKVKFK